MPSSLNRKHPTLFNCSQKLSDMEREQYQNRIKDLLQAIETLLKSNNAMGERLAQLEKKAAVYDDLKAVIKRMESQTGSDYPECEQAR